MEFNGLRLVEPCPEKHTNREVNYGTKTKPHMITITDTCYTCYGSNEILTDVGRELLKFIKTYGDFAEKDHSHTLS